MPTCGGLSPSCPPAYVHMGHFRSKERTAAPPTPAPRHISKLYDQYYIMTSTPRRQPMTVGSTAQGQSRPGRPRSERSRAAVLHATSELMQEVGLRAMTTDEIANRSGTSKATIYKWWPNKYAVAVEAFLSEMFAESADPNTGSAHEDFRIYV